MSDCIASHTEIIVLLFRREWEYFLRHLHCGPQQGVGKEGNKIAYVQLNLMIRAEDICKVTRKTGVLAVPRLNESPCPKKGLPIRWGCSVKEHPLT